MRIASALLAVLLMAGCSNNKAPDVPSTPTGPSTVAKDSLAAFSSAATDPEGDSIRIRFCWGDSDTSAWSEQVASGDTVTMTYAWTAVAACSVRAQVKDVHEVLSQWSSALGVNVVAFSIVSFGGSINDHANSVQPTPDGGFIIVGGTNSWGAGYDDVWLVKTDSAGNKLWDKVFGGAEFDDGNSVRPTADGGYIATGALGGDFWLIRTDGSGNKLWDKTYGWEMGNAVLTTADGGFVAAGSDTGTEGAARLLKVDADGNVVWDRVYDSPFTENASDLQPTADGGFIMTGYTEHEVGGNTDIWLLRADSAGNELWQTSFGHGWMDYGRSVWQTSDGGYVIAGEHSDGTYYGASLIKTNADGNEIWENVFDKSRGDEGWNSVLQAADGGYVVAGYATLSSSGAHSMSVAKTDANGNEVWYWTFAGYEAKAVRQMADGGYIIVGSGPDSTGQGQDFWLVRFYGP